MIDILRNIGGVEQVVCRVAHDNATVIGEIMAREEVNIDVVVDAPLNLAVGDYVRVDDTVYTLNRETRFDKKSEVEYRYDLLFESPLYRLLDKLFINPLTGLSSFVIFRTLKEFVELVVENINLIDLGWSMSGSIPEHEPRNISFEVISCREALKKIAEEFDVEFFLIGKEIHFVNRIENDTNLVFEQGKGKGLYTITQQPVDNENTVTRIIPYGSSQNVFPGEGDVKGRLFLPEKYLENFSEYNRVVEKEVEFKDIFPRLKGTIESVSGEFSKVVKCSGVNFNVTEQAIGGTTVKINFLSGDLMGESFEFLWDDSKKEATLLLKDDETALADKDGNKPQIPRDLKKAKAGDRFNFTDLYMPPTYRVEAEGELRAKAQDWLNYYSRSRVKYTLDVDHRYLRGKRILKAGDLVTIKIPETKTEGILRIISVERNLKTGKVNCTVSNYLDEKWEKKIEGEISTLKSTVSSSTNSNNSKVERPSSLYYFDKRHEYLHLNEDGTVTLLENNLSVKGNGMGTGNVAAYATGDGDISDWLGLLLDPATLAFNDKGLITVIGGTGGGGVDFTAGIGLQMSADNVLSVKYGVAAGTAAAGNDSRIINGDAANTKLKNGSWWGQKMSDNGSVGGDVLLGAGNVISQIIGVTGGWARGLHWSPVGAINDVGGLSMYGIGTSPAYIRVGFGAFNALTNLFINPAGDVGIGANILYSKLTVVSGVLNQSLLYLENTANKKKLTISTTDKGWIQFGNSDNSASILNISGINASLLSELILYATQTNIIGRGLIGGSLQVNGTSLFVGIPKTGAWWYSTGNTGWFNETYQGGIYMNDSDHVQVYNNKVFYNSGYRTWGIGSHYCGLKLYAAPHIGINLANNAYTWGIYSNVDGNMYIGRRNGNVNDGSGSYAIILGLNHLNMNGNISASGNVKASGNVVAYAVGSGDISLPIASAAALGAIRVGPTLKITPEGVLDTLASGLAGFNTTGVGNGVGDVTYNSGTKVMTVTKTNFLTTAQGGNYVLKTGDTMSGTLRFNMNGVSSSISSDNSQFLHFRTNAPAGFYFDRSVKVSGELYGGSAYNKLVFHEGNYLTKRQQYTISATKYREITVTGDKDTFYPVAIIFNDVTNSLDYDLYLGKELGSTSNSGWAGNHGNGTSSCAGHWRFRSNGWDGNCNYVQTIRTSFPYAPLLARIEMLGGAFAGVVLWLRGGTANYGLSCDAGFSAINIYYTTANIGNVQYPYNVAPIALANINSYNKGQYSSGDCVISAGINANYLKFPARNLWGQSFDGTGNVTGTWALNGDIMSTTNNTRIDGGAIELYRSIPVIDFHFANAAADFTSRIVESSSGQLNINGTNFVKTAVLPDTPITLGSTTNPWESVVVKNWLYTLGNTGWYNSTYGGGMHMMDNVWVRVYNDKKFYVSNTAVDAIQCGGGFNSGGAGGSGLSVAGSESCSTRIKGQIGSGSNAPVSRYEVQWYNQFARFDVHRGTTADILKWSWKANDTEVGSLSFGGTFYAPVLSAGRIYTGFDGTRTGGISCSNWFASNGNTGWVNDTYGGGIYMNDSDHVQVYNNKVFYNSGARAWGIGSHYCGLKLYAAPHIGINLANNAYTWGIYSNADGNMYIGRRNGNVNDGSGSYAIILGLNHLNMNGNISASGNVKASGNVVAYAVGSGDITLPIATNIAYGAIKYDNSSILKNLSGQLYLNPTQGAQYSFTNYYTNLPGHYFHNRYDGGSEVYVHYYSSGTTGLVSNANLRFANGAGGFRTWRISGSGAANWEGTFTSGSDITIKNVFGEVTDMLSKLDNIKVYRYAFKDDKEQTPHIGLIAQEVMQVFPEFVTRNNTLFLDYQSMGATLAVHGFKQVKCWMTDREKRERQMVERIAILEQVITDHGWELPAPAVA